MSYSITITDSAGVHQLPPLEVPLTRVKNEGITTVIPLSGNRYKDYIYTNLIYSHTWAWLTKEEYDLLDEIYERQKTEFIFPSITVEGDSITNMVVDFELGQKNIADDCGIVQNVTVNFYQTINPS